MRDLFYLSETQFNRIKPYFPLSHGGAACGRFMGGQRDYLRDKEMACNGRTLPKATARPRRSTIASCAGARWAYSTAFLRNWLAKPEHRIG